MKFEDFKKLLEIAGLSVPEFADLLGVNTSTIYNWSNKNRDVPYWVSSWLDNYIKAKDADRYKSLLLDILKEMGDDILDKYVGDNLTRNHLLQKVIMSSDDDDPRLLMLLQKLKKSKKIMPQKEEPLNQSNMTISKDNFAKALEMAMEKLYKKEIQELRKELEYIKEELKNKKKD